VHQPTGKRTAPPTCPACRMPLVWLGAKERVTVMSCMLDWTMQHCRRCICKQGRVGAPDCVRASCATAPALPHSQVRTAQAVRYAGIGAKKGGSALCPTPDCLVDQGLTVSRSLPFTHIPIHHQSRYNEY
jgi:hypothetical protein